MHTQAPAAAGQQAAARSTRTSFASTGSRCCRWVDLLIWLHAARQPASWPAARLALAAPAGVPVHGGPRVHGCGADILCACLRTSQAVHGIHELRIVHSDLKPANFLLGGSASISDTVAWAANASGARCAWTVATADVRGAALPVCSACHRQVQGQLKLIDFGIAKSIQGDTTSINRESQV